MVVRRTTGSASSAVMAGNGMRTRDNIITTLFSTDYIEGEALGSDDIAEVRWFTLETIQKMIEAEQTAPEHTKHLKVLLNKYTMK